MEIGHGTEIAFMLGSFAVALIGIGLAWAFYGGGYREPAKKFAAAVPGFVKLVQDKFRIDELYAAIFVRPIKKLGNLIFVAVDRILIDRIAVEGTAGLTSVVSRVPRWFQNGDGQGYMAWFAIGAAVLVYFSIHPAVSSDLKPVTNGMSVELDARPGSHSSQLPLEYEFDFDDDGKPEVTGTASTARHTYARPGKYKIRVTVRNPAWETKRTQITRVEVQ
jgi:hypothetical protein